ncbi:MAG: helix-turn-helix domain-containing protein [Kofleriaceae bacterium]
MTAPREPAPSTLDVVRAIFEASASDPGAEHDITEEARAPSNDTDPAKSGDLHAVLGVEDIAALLRVGRNTVYSLVARNQIPHRRLGKQIRFSRAAVMSWLATSWQVAREGK